MNEYILEKQNVNKIASTVKEYGFCIIPNYFSDTDFQQLVNEVEGVYSQVPEGHEGICSVGGIQNMATYPAGKSLVVDRGFYPKIPVINRLFFQDPALSSQVDEYYGGRCDKFMQTFSTKELGKVMSEDLGRQSWMHVDPYASMKYACFLTKTTSENGALRVIPGSRACGQKIREEWMWKTDKKGIKGGMPHRLVDFPPEMVTVKEEDAIYIECNPGDLVAIDTDVFHAGGDIQKEGETRTAIYVHNRPL